MGEVLLAVAHGVAGFTKLVVLKRARPDLADEPQVLAMFLDEARLAARLNHPNVVQTYEAGQEAGCFFIAMEYLDGQPLHRIRTRVEPRWFPLSMQIRILIEALAGLHYAHELTDFDGTPLGVIHRDATPQNVFVTYDGQIKVVDFGIAKAKSSTIKTRAGMIKGKATYMAPEQARSESLDRRADIFTVGIMLWETLAGERMWKGVPNTEIIRRLAAGKLPSLPDEAPHTDPELTRICRRALAPLPAERYATAAELQHGLERWLVRQGEEVTARAVGTFVAAHFEKERSLIKALLEEELRPYASCVQPKVDGAALPSLDIDSTIVHSEASSGLPVPAISPPAVPDVTAGDGTPPPITATMRSQLPSPISADPPPMAPVSSRSSVEEPASPLHLDEERSSPPPAPAGYEALRRSSASLDTVTEILSASPSQRRRWKPLAIGSAILITGALAVVGFTLRLPSVSEDSAAAAHAPLPAGAVELTVRVLPTTARIFVDGTPVATGWYKDKLLKDGRVHWIRAEAPNFVPMEQSITASADVILSLALERKSASAP
jgi:serine/threonine protein kinase